MDIDTDTTHESQARDLELPEACVGCGGPVQARFTAHGALGVCLACHMIATLGVIRERDGVHVGHLARSTV